MGDENERRFVGQVRKGCRIAAKLREFGVRPHGVVRIDSACSVTDWDKDPKTNTKKSSDLQGSRQGRQRPRRTPGRRRRDLLGRHA
jgi:hypothetical protein